MPQRKRGAQPGNQNAVTHGRHSRPSRERRQAEWEAQQAHHREWMATVPATDYGAICDALAKLKRETDQ
ncbi:MAG: hypothetical protein JWQ51_2767 [Tardiphaga sp.]|nr:hypothetical protein [Tardiphaga sp.]